MTRQGTAPSHAVPEEDRLRARYYRFLARLLVSAPDQPLLDLLAALEGDDTPLGRAHGALAAEAAAMRPDALIHEFNELFIGIGRGELVPYGSYYLTGFLNEKPLARLRDDMARLRIERAAEVSEPEDHVAAVCEMMAGLIDGSFGEPSGIAEQRRFFEAHLGSWAGRFFEDLESAAGARFYRPVGSLGRLFLEVEAEAFRMAE